MHRVSQDSVEPKDLWEIQDEMVLPVLGALEERRVAWVQEVNKESRESLEERVVEEKEENWVFKDLRENRALQET